MNKIYLVYDEQYLCDDTVTIIAGVFDTREKAVAYALSHDCNWIREMTTNAPDECDEVFESGAWELRVKREEEKKRRDDEAQVLRRKQAFEKAVREGRVLNMYVDETGRICKRV